jgi:glycosyltransferase involved in cell wall biosynthesis
MTKWNSDLGSLSSLPYACTPRIRFMPKISIITPCYNSESFIGATIESVRNQTFADWECIVVNDGSTDSSEDTVGSYLKLDQRLQLLNQPNGGVCKARNNGFKAASPDSEYLLFLDADDCLEAAMLETLSKYLDSHPEVGLVYSDHTYIDSQGEFINASDHGIVWSQRYVPTRWGIRTLEPDEAETPFCSVFTLAGLVPSMSLIRRSVFETSGGFDEEFGQHYEETDLFLRMVLNTRFHYLPQKLVRHRRHPAQSTAHTEKFARQEIKLYSTWANVGHLPKQQQDVVKHAQWFREHRMGPFSGFAATRRHLKRREWALASRFFIGALRRYRLLYSTSSFLSGDIPRST